MKRVWILVVAVFLGAGVLVAPPAAATAGAPNVAMATAGAEDPFFDVIADVQRSTYPGTAAAEFFLSTDWESTNGILSVREGGRLVWSKRMSYVAEPVMKLTQLSAGRHTFKATYSGDAYYRAKTITFSVIIGKAEPKLAVRSAPAGPLRAKLTVSASASAAGAITAYYAGRVVARGKLVKGKGTLTLPRKLKVGTNKITVRYAGSANVRAREKSVVVKATGYGASLRASAKAVTYPAKSVLTVKATGKHGQVKGSVSVNVMPGKKFNLVGGKRTITLPKFATGTRNIRVSLNGAGTVYNSRTITTNLTVKKAPTTSKPKAPTPPSVPGRPADINCSDFSTHAQAQAWFDKYYPYYGDVARLDADHDGLACESLP